MNVRPLGANKTELRLNSGAIVFVSYETPVAAFVPGRGWLRTETRHSVTTSKHINQWLGGPAVEVPQAEINALLEN
jgi:hypothetical protein